MKIKRISLYNIGPYVGLNSFDFSLDKNKNIVLIGGKNGAGKTTFFKSIKTCLYGCKVWGFDAPCKEYYSVINGLVNSKSMYANSAVAFIEIELFFYDGKQENIYTLHREWKKSKMTFCEFFNVKKNGDLIIGHDENDFINYLLSIIPPDMFNLYFFDGESIAEFFLGSEGNKNFRNAFLKLYGLDTLSIMVENFNRNIKKGNSNNSNYIAYLNAKTTYEDAEESCDLIAKELSSYEAELDATQMLIEALQVNYKKDGGISLAEWKKLNSDLLKEESDREIINKWLKDMANHYLPFIILNNEMEALLRSLDENQKSQKSRLLIDEFKSAEFVLAIDSFIKKHNLSNIVAKDLAEYLSSSFTLDNCSLNYDLSINQLNKVISQIHEKAGFDRNLIKENVVRLNDSLDETKRIREVLSSSNIDNYEHFIAEKEQLEKRISELHLLIADQKKKYEASKDQLEISIKDLNSCKAAYESVLKSKSISNISERAAAAFSLVEERLVARQAKLLQSEFIRCFNSIINKNNFIDGIVVDGKINVIPYKYITIRREQLENYSNHNQAFLNVFKDANLVMEMNKLEFCEVDSIRVPAPITAPFSQGERQVYIMSLYLALLKTSHKDIPFFIDTPFARIDSSHRESIVSEFFMKLDNQMFVLSTDEEIVGDYKSMMNEKISNTFRLSTSEYGSTQIVANEYFGD